MKSNVVIVREVNAGTDCISVFYSVVTCLSDFLTCLRDSINREPQGVYPESPRSLNFGVCVDGLAFVLSCTYDVSTSSYLFEVLNPARIDANFLSVPDLRQMGHLYLSAFHIFNSVLTRSASYVRGVNNLNHCFLKDDYTPLCFVDKRFSCTCSLRSFVRAAVGFDD